MAGMAFSTWFWDMDVWLPPGYTWDSLAQAQHFTYPIFNDLWTYPFVLAVIFIAFRYLILIPHVFTPLGFALGVKDVQYRQPQPNATLEAVFKKHQHHVPPEAVFKAAETLGWTERQVERWLRQRAMGARTTPIKKFCELAWDIFYYSFYCVFGIVVLWDKPWLWDIRHCWIGFPEHHIDDIVWWYYMVSLGYYWSMTLTHSMIYQRKDAVQLFIHHVLTIILIVLSWTCNFIRVGTLVLIVHECADIPMLLAKTCKLCGAPRLMDLLFVVFLLLWLCTRTGLYPFWIMRSTLFEAHVILDMWYPVYYIFNGLLLALLVIHVIWTYFIVRIVYRKLSGSRLQDVRSSSETSFEGDDEMAHKKEN